MQRGTHNGEGEEEVGPPQVDLRIWKPPQRRFHEHVATRCRVDEEEHRQDYRAKGHPEDGRVYLAVDCSVVAEERKNVSTARLVPPSATARLRLDSAYSKSERLQSPSSAAPPRPSTANKSEATPTPRGRSGRALNLVIHSPLHPTIEVLFNFGVIPAFRSGKDRWAIFVAGDDAEAKRIVSGLIESIGFVPIDTGSLREGGRLQQPGPPIYAKRLTEEQARALLQSLKKS